MVTTSSSLKEKNIVLRNNLKRNQKGSKFYQSLPLSSFRPFIYVLLSILVIVIHVTIVTSATGFLSSSKKQSESARSAFVLDSSIPSHHHQSPSSKQAPSDNTKINMNPPVKSSSASSVRQDDDLHKIAHSDATLNLAKKESAEHLHGMADVYATMNKRPLRIRAFALENDTIDVTDQNKNVKVIHFVRHGQGFHNLMADLAHAAGQEWTQFTQTPENPYIMPEILDAPLTQKGRDQARVLQSRLKDMPSLPQMVALSPNCRALQTGTIAFQPLLLAKDVPFIAHEMIREETGVHVCDQRRPKSQQASEFPMVNFDLIESEDDQLFNSNTRETKSQVAERIYTFMQWLSDRPEKHIAVVSHSGWLFTVFNGICECEDEELKNWFHTGEMRSVKFLFSS